MSVCLKKENESVCVCGCVCPRAENMFVIKMTEYEGEVPLEGWVATYLHTHTHTYTHTQRWMFFSLLLEVQRCYTVPLLASLAGIKPATPPTSVQHQQTADTYIFVLTTHTHT